MMGVGTDGDDVLAGGAGNETLDGLSGNDTVNYGSASTGVIANLATGEVGYMPKIMPMGDSITYGIASLDNGGYRGPLEDMLADAGLTVNFVGSNPIGDLADPDNEGHGGWTISGIRQNVADWLRAEEPDVVMLIIGTNDTSRNPPPAVERMIERLGGVIDRIHETLDDPPKLFIGPAPPMHGSQSADRIALVQAYNAAIPELVALKRAAGVDVTFVDMSDLTSADITPPPIDPGVHPNASGYQKIAEHWFDALLTLGTDKGTLAGGPHDQLVSIENLTGSEHRDVLTGTDDANRLVGLKGGDILDGGGGGDTMVGGAGDDTYFMDDVDDVLIEQADEGDDTVMTTFGSYSLLDTFENVTFIGTGNFSGLGNELYNELRGALGDDTLDSGGGQDVLVGGAGDDLLIGGTEYDLFYGGPGNDTYVLDLGVETAVETLTIAEGGGIDTVMTPKNYTLGVNVENLILTGISSRAAIGNEYNNRLTGNLGNNILDGGLGADTMSGMDGKDSYYVDDPGDVVSEIDPATGADAGGYDTLYTKLLVSTLPQYFEALTTLNTDPAVGFQGTGNNSASVNWITGGPGADTLSGGSDDVKDVLEGGAGNDTYVVLVNDVIFEQPGGGYDTVRTSFNVYQLADNLEGLTFTGTGVFRAVGNPDANLITGGSGDDALDGGLGADTLVGGAGSDTYVVDNTGDVVGEADPLTGLDAGGVDTIKTTASAYTLGSYIEKLSYIGSGDFAGTGNGLDNVLTGGAGADTLTAGLGNDVVNAGGGGDRLVGDDGNDKLNGEAGQDTLVGGLGTDVLTGGLDGDYFYFGSAVANSRDTIADFVQGQDRIALQGSGFSASLTAGALDPGWFVAGSSATATGHGQFVYASATKTLSWDADGLGGAAGVPIAVFSTAVNLNASDFLLA
jgi:Ca2+-binding RTX toxin-like protein